MSIPYFRLNRKVVAAQGLVGLWGPGPTGSGSHFDMSGRAGNGALAAGVTWGVDERYGQVPYFDGTAANVITLDEFPYFEAIPNFSILASVKLTNVARDSDIVTKGVHGSNNPFVFWFDNASPDHWQFLMTDSGSDYSGVLTSAHVPVANVWYDLAFTFESGEARLFINSVEDGNSPFTLAGIDDVKSTVDPWRLGNSASLAGRFTGYFGPTRFYTRTLSPADVQHVYQKNRAVPYADIERMTRQIFKAPAAGIAVLRRRMEAA